MSNSSKDMAEYRDGGAIATVARPHRATPPLTGTFDVEFENSRAEGIPNRRVYVCIVTNMSFLAGGMIVSLNRMIPLTHHWLPRPACSPLPLCSFSQLNLHNQYLFSGLSVDISKDDLKYALEGIAGMGEVKVEWVGTCRRPKWRVEWLTKPGDQPLLQVRLHFLFHRFFFFS